MITDISAYMTSDVITVRPEASIAEAMALLQSHSIRHLPVVDKDGNIRGMLSDRDLINPSAVNAIVTGGASPEQFTIEKVMSRTTFVVRPTDKIIDAGQLLKKYCIGALPVIDNLMNGNLVGILSYVDILRAYIDATQELAAAGHETEAMATDDKLLAEVIDSGMVQRWEARMGVELPSTYKNDLLAPGDNHPIFIYCIPDRMADYPELVAFARWNDVIYAFDIRHGKQGDYPIMAVTPGLPPEATHAHFEEWLKAVQESSQKTIASE